MKRNAYAKINLGLDVTGVRPNGYHDVEMIMQTVDLYDVLEFEKLPDQKGVVELSVNVEGLGNIEDNLIYKSAKLMLEEGKLTDGVRIKLEKNIPVAAGMAGGSTDAATTFLGINDLFELGFSGKRLRELGVSLGADIPYCIMGGTALAKGIGEELEILPDVKGEVLLIAKPSINVSTKMVYEALDSKPIEKHPDIAGMVKAIKEGNEEGILSRLGNVLELVTCSLYPVIDEIKAKMLDMGARNSLMSGSGPTVFGIFANKEDAEKCKEALQATLGLKEVYVTSFHAGNGRKD